MKPRDKLLQAEAKAILEKLMLFCSPTEVIYIAEILTLSGFATMAGNGQSPNVTVQLFDKNVSQMRVNLIDGLSASPKTTQQEVIQLS